MDVTNVRVADKKSFHLVPAFIRQAFPVEVDKIHVWKMDIIQNIVDNLREKDRIAV